MTPILRSSDKQFTIAIVGLGYVGLPLAVEFGKKFPTLGLVSPRRLSYVRGVFLTHSWFLAPILPSGGEFKCIKK